MLLAEIKAFNVLINNKKIFRVTHKKQTRTA